MCLHVRLLAEAICCLEILLWTCIKSRDPVSQQLGGFVPRGQHPRTIYSNFLFLASLAHARAKIWFAGTVSISARVVVVVALRWDCGA